MSKPTIKHFMCDQCQAATSVVNNPTGWGRHACEWCGRLEWGKYVSNVPPKKKG